MNNMFAVRCNADGTVVAPFESHEVAEEWIAEDAVENDCDIGEYCIHPFFFADHPAGVALLS